MSSTQPIDAALCSFLDEQPAAGPVQSSWDARKRMEKALECRESIAGLPNDVHTAEHFAWNGEERGVRLRAYTPHAHHSLDKPLPVLVYLHGGGWVAGSIETHDPFCRLLCALSGVSIVSVDYRRAPESPHPAALEDARHAFHWVHQHAALWGGDPGALALGGDSAGAQVAAVAANHLAIEAGAPALKALVLLYPVTDHYSAGHPSYKENATGYGLMAESMHWFWDQYLGSASPDDPAVSPLRSGVFPHLPPTLIATAEYDVLRDEGIAYARKLSASGIHVTHVHAGDMHHDFPVSPATVARFPQCHAALGQIAAFLRAQMF